MMGAWPAPHRPPHGHRRCLGKPTQCPSFTLPSTLASPTWVSSRCSTMLRCRSRAATLSSCSRRDERRPSANHSRCTRTAPRPEQLANHRETAADASSTAICLCSNPQSHAAQLQKRPRRLQARITPSTVTGSTAGAVLSEAPAVPSENRDLPILGYMAKGSRPQAAHGPGRCVSARVSPACRAMNSSKQIKPRVNLSALTLPSAL